MDLNLAQSRRRALHSCCPADVRLDAREWLTQRRECRCSQDPDHFREVAGKHLPSEVVEVPDSRLGKAVHNNNAEALRFVEVDRVVAIDVQMLQIGLQCLPGNAPRPERSLLRSGDAILHEGGTASFSSWLAYYPEYDLTVSALCNSLGPNASAIRDLVLDLTGVAVGH